MMTIDPVECERSLKVYLYDYKFMDNGNGPPTYRCSINIYSPIFEGAEFRVKISNTFCSSMHCCSTYLKPMIPFIIEGVHRAYPW